METMSCVCAGKELSAEFLLSIPEQDSTSVFPWLLPLSYGGLSDSGTVPRSFFR